MSKKKASRDDLRQIANKGEKIASVMEVLKLVTSYPFYRELDDTYITIPQEYKELAFKLLIELFNDFNKITDRLTIAATLLYTCTKDISSSEIAKSFYTTTDDIKECFSDLKDTKSTFAYRYIARKLGITNRVLTSTRYFNVTPSGKWIEVPKEEYLFETDGYATQKDYENSSMFQIRMEGQQL